MTMKNFGPLIMIQVAILVGQMNAQVSVIGELSQEKEAQPGETYEGVIIVKNDTNEPQEAKVYQTDYLFYYNGTNNYAEPGSTPRSNARWVTFSPSFVTLRPQSTAAINYTVTVPQNTGAKKLAGTYWSMLMIEGIERGSAESSLPLENKKSHMGIRQTIRYGLQIVSHIAHTGIKKIAFLETKLVSKKEGGRFLQVDIENTGDIGLRPDVYVELFDEKGVSKGRFSGVRYRMYPGTSVRQMIDLSTVPGGNYKALVVVDAGGDDAYGAQYNFTF